jgi:hypothetical protein
MFRQVTLAALAFAATFAHADVLETAEDMLNKAGSQAIEAVKGDLAEKAWNATKEGAKDAWNATMEGGKIAWNATKDGVDKAGSLAGNEIKKLREETPAPTSDATSSSISIIVVTSTLSAAYMYTMA